jgi:hypothetical protein
MSKLDCISIIDTNLLILLREIITFILSIIQSIQKQCQVLNVEYCTNSNHFTRRDSDGLNGRYKVR